MGVASGHHLRVQMKILPGANIGNKKDEEEDNAKAIEPSSHPAPYHTLMMTAMVITMIRLTMKTDESDLDT